VLSKSDETERASTSSASGIGRHQILAGSLVAMPANWDENQVSAELSILTQIVISELPTIGIGSLIISRRRVTYPRPLCAQVIAIKQVIIQELEVAGIAPASRNGTVIIPAKRLRRHPSLRSAPGMHGFGSARACRVLTPLDGGCQGKDRGTGAGPARFRLFWRVVMLVSGVPDDGVSPLAVFFLKAIGR
jgi:hypothetical protein